MRRISSSISIALSILLLVSIGSAQPASTTSVPNLIRYSGTLKEAATAATSSVTIGVTFAIYKGDSLPVTATFHCTGVHD